MSIDPYTLEILRHELNAVPNQVDKNLTRTAFSPLINEYKDYAVGIVDASGALVSQSRGSLLIFAANALGTAVKDGLAIYGAEELRHGDIVITNHAGTMGQHLNNVAMYTPIRADGGTGELLGFFCVLMHWIDVGGIVVGSCTSTNATEVFQEGIQFRTVKLFDRGARVAEMFRMIEHNTRFPKELLGDVEAQIAGCLMGRDQVLALTAKSGVPAWHAAVRSLFDNAEARVRAALTKAPKGRFAAEAFIDDDGLVLGKRVPIAVTVTIEDHRVVVDLSGVADQLAGPMNAGRNGGAVAAARIAFKYLFSPEEPVNEGDFRALEVVIPDGKFLSAHASAAVGASGNMMPTTVDTILRALAPAFPERIAAAHHGSYGAHIFFGQMRGERFFHLDTCVGGWGATASSDGYGPSRSNVHGDTSDVPIEMQEATLPFRFEGYALREDSGGPGRTRGGLGVIKRYHITAPCTLSLRFDRTECPPWGLAGGDAGATPEVDILRANGELRRSFNGEHALLPGDGLVIRTAGGGGYGPARERDATAVQADIASGVVSVSAALERYAVVVGSEGRVDAEATQALRARPVAVVAQDVKVAA
ncbi:MAG: hydantoinase B/oxoprolinase family protein [Pseudomonadota bacterium]